MCRIKSDFSDLILFLPQDDDANENDKCIESKQKADTKILIEPVIESYSQTLSSSSLNPSSHQHCEIQIARSQQVAQQTINMCLLYWKFKESLHWCSNNYGFMYSQTFLHSLHKFRKEI